MRRGLSWSLAGAITTNGLRIVVIAVLGRTLTSADFGVVAAAISVNAILYGIRDVGIGRALIQRKAIDDRHVTTTFAISLYLGLGLTTALVLAAPVIASFFNISGSVDVIRALALLFALRGVSLTSRMLCERALRFNAIAITDAGSFALGSLVSMIAAVQGAGPWALVLGYLVEEGIAAASYMAVSPPKLSLRVDRQGLRDLMSFGIGQTITQLAGMLATYGDNFVVGHTLGAKDLGYYTRAYDFIRMPSFIFEAVVGKVLFPSFSRIQDDRERLGDALRRVMFVNALVLLPMSAVVVVMAPEVIRLLVGPGWDSAVLPLQILAVTILPRTNQKIGAIITQAAGRANAIALAYIVYMVIVVGGAAITIRWGVPGVAVTTSLAIVVVFAQSTFLAMQVTGTSLAAVVAAHGPGLVLVGLVVGIAVPTASALRSFESNAFISLAVVGIVSVLACLGLVYVWWRRNRGDFGWLRTEFSRLRRKRAATP